MKQIISPNSPKAWILAARPKTLAGAAVPVGIATAMAWTHTGGQIEVVPAVLCLLFALVMQIDANFINDYFDFIRGNDDKTRLGPKRACAQGWISTRAMRAGILTTTLAACAIGLPLVCYGGIQLIAIGLLCVLFCFLYTTHLSYKGLGDVLVLVFFGWVPVLLTYYLETGAHFTGFNPETLTAATTCGAVIDLLLIVNNYRDMNNDRRAGKLTLVLRLGARTSLRLYAGIGVAVCAAGTVFAAYGHLWAFVLPLVFLLPHYRTFRHMQRIGKGEKLNLILGETARNIVIYGCLTAIGFLL